MTDRAITKETMLNALHDIHLPEVAPGGALSEMFAVAAIAAACGMLIAALLRSILRPKPSAQGDPLHVKLAALAEQSEDDRRTALFHMLKTEHPAKFAQLSPTLYRPGQQVTISQLEAMLLTDA